LLFSSDAACSDELLILKKVKHLRPEVEIGRGTYGRVFEVEYKKIRCAAKQVHALLLESARGKELQTITENFLHECRIWSQLRHPCIVQFIGLFILINQSALMYSYIANYYIDIYH